MEFTQDNDQFSYEKQGVITQDIVLIIVFHLIFIVTAWEMRNFSVKYDVESTPNFYCLIAIVF